MVKTIIFDLSEVLLRGLMGSHDGLSKFLNEDASNFNFQIPELQSLFEGKISEEEYLETLVKKHQGYKISVDDLKKIIRQNFQEIEGTRLVIGGLRENGYKLGLLSVHAREWVDYCEQRFQYRDLFDCISYSFESSICKPDSRAYELLLSNLNSSPNETIFIDDSAENVDSAISLGIHSIQFSSADQLLIDLKNAGIKIL